MVCIYCGSRTSVTNSRRQIKSNQVWRRRVCLVCKGSFTTGESVDLEQSVAVTAEKGVMEPFSRDKLFISINSACGHRKRSVDDAAALTATIINKLRSAIKNAAIDRRLIVQAAVEVLERFDKAAAVQYLAYHPVK